MTAPQKVIHIRYYKPGQNSEAGKVMGPSGESFAIVLINGHNVSIKLHPKISQQDGLLS